MNILKKAILAVALIGGASASHAAELYLTGDACQWGWNLNPQLNAMVETETPNVFRGITYLSTNGKFKFLPQANFIGDHYLMKPKTTGDGGVIKLVKTYNGAEFNDAGEEIAWQPWLDTTGFKSGNFDIIVDLRDPENPTCTLTPIEYQDTPIWGKGIMMVGDPCPNGWDKNNGVILYNSYEEPWIYSATWVELKKGNYKFTIDPARDWGESWAWLKKDPADAGKFYKGLADDSNFYNDHAGHNDVIVNSLTGTVSCSKTVGSGVEEVAVEEGSVEYFTLTGVRVESPAKGIYIRKAGNKVEKVVL